MITRVMTLWSVHVTSLTTFVSTRHFLIEIMFILKAIKSHFKGSYDKQDLTLVVILYEIYGGGWVLQRCWANFQCRGVLLIWIIAGHGPFALAVVVGGGCWDFLSLIHHFSFLSPFLLETVRYRLKYCPKGPLSLK